MNEKVEEKKEGSNLKKSPRIEDLNKHAFFDQTLLNIEAERHEKVKFKIKCTIL